MTRVGDERLAEMLAAAGDYIANYVADFDDAPPADPVGEFNPYTITAIITELVELRKAVKPFAAGSMDVSGRAVIGVTRDDLDRLKALTETDHD